MAWGLPCPPRTETGGGERRQSLQFVPVSPLRHPHRPPTTAADRIAAGPAVLVCPLTRCQRLLGQAPRGQRGLLPDCAQHSYPPNPKRAETRSCPMRAQFYRARSASKKDTWPLPYLSEGARCASKGNSLLALLFPCPLLASYGIMPSLGDGDGTFARICRFSAYLSWTIPRESDLLVFEANGDWVPDRPKGLSVE